MLAIHTPSMDVEWELHPEQKKYRMKGVIRNEQLDELQDKHCYEIISWPAYLPDQVCMDLLRKNNDPNVVLFIAMMKGITPIVTIGDHKSFVATFEKKKKPKRHLPTYHSRVDSNKEQVEKHLRDQRDFA